MAQLQVRVRGEVLRVLTLSRQLSIGRTPDNGLPLRDPSVAIRHAEITAEVGALLLTDLTGGEGVTFVNGHRLSPNQPHRLEQGDEIQIGPFTLAFLADPSVTAEAARPAGRVDVQGELAARPARPPLPTFTAERPPHDGLALYTEFLPPFFQESEFLGRYLKIFEAMWEPLQRRQDSIELHFDPRVAPPQVLGWMAGWLGLPLDPHWPEGRQRAWMREAVTLYRWRGTRYGLSRALETVYGLTPVLREDTAQPHTLTVQLLDSPDGEDTASREAITQFIFTHAPAHVRVTVEFVEAPATAAPPADPGLQPVEAPDTGPRA
ncbi:FHA domain-containing protein [Deinococcus multiflagellatus]|uniref:FHA domain-containing protein n=1 Tax=Deinococcus multiflagellatus TaxID=1656887 RepID=UPI001CCB1449|nr:FHA domain-containing protein [Deinococcus multiflagellatus]MBZ9713606.1 FHA domain-containing protein [Deinococcus multiflagellatus]